MKVAQIRGIAAYLPEGRLDNKELAQIFSNWTEEKIKRKIGIETRPIAAEGETAVDLGVAAGERLLASGVVERDEIDFVVLCTQSPDYFLPSSACLIQSRLGLKTGCGAFDINLGCSGYVYGLGVCKGLIESGIARKVLFITAETYSKYINEKDRVTRPLFGDGATATLLEAADLDVATSDALSGAPAIGPFEYGTDGNGANMLIVEAGASRLPASPETSVAYSDSQAGYRSKEQLFMNGAGIFTFSIDVVPPLVKRCEQIAADAGMSIDAYIFHQANRFMLDRLREECGGLDERKFFNSLLTRGNTVSSSIPIAIIDAVRDGMVKPGSCALLVGFGVGLSWGAGFVRFPENFQVVPLED
ncbi:MAG: ketoacyl-ACP synthase III [Thermoguttaceae bacterium]|nr:ketoacyl-ACP synthase III [Thermoguttaceae bacterium]